MKMDTMNRLIYDEKLLKLSQYWLRMRAKTRRINVKKISAEHGISISTIYKDIKKYQEGGSRTGTNRVDRGNPRLCSREKMKEYVKIVMGLKAYDPTKPDKKRSNANKSMSTARAIEIAENMGKIPEGLLTPRTVNRWAKIFGITVKNICSPRPAVKLVSLHPNHVMLVDFSVCDQYYLHNSTGAVKKRRYTYKNKPNEAKEKIWLFVLVDHYSGVIYAKYFLSPGESAKIFYQGIVEALSKKDDTHFPFHGAPRIVYMDKGASWKSQKTKNMFDALKIKVITHKPGNPRAKGMVESAIGYIQRNFESELLLKSAQTIEELNNRVYNWMVEYNWKAKEGETKSRFNKWLEISSSDKLLELPPKHILARVTASHLIRTVDAYCNVSVNGETFGVPTDVLGKKVRVWFNIDGGISVQDIETGKVHPTVDRKVAVFGEYNAYKKSEAERMQDDAIRIIEEKQKEITPKVLLRETPNMHGLSRTGTPIEIDSDLVQEEHEEYRSRYQAKMAIADELRINLGDLPEWMIEKIDNALAGNLNKKKVHKMARFIENFLKEARNAV